MHPRKYLVYSGLGGESFSQIPFGDRVIAIKEVCFVCKGDGFP